MQYTVLLTIQGVFIRNKTVVAATVNKPLKAESLKSGILAFMFPALYNTKSIIIIIIISKFTECPCIHENEII